MPRYCVYKVRTKCPECGHPVIVDGPLTSIECGSCFEVFQIPEDTWKSILERAYSDPAESSNLDVWSKGLSLSAEVGRQLPRCPSCREPFSLDTIPETTSGPIFCGHCGFQSSSHPTPKWLRALLPADRLYCAATVEDPEGAQPLVVPNADRPVLMACMGCGASLKITIESARVTTCSYCDAENFLPDPLWRRLHPVKKRIPWYIRFTH